MISILLVDDDKTNSLLLKRYLEVEEFDVRYAENGQNGLKIYNTFHPDVILLDVNMPDIDGFEVAKKIRQNDNETLLFFLTDRTEKTDRLHGFELKGNDYIPKPFYPEELILRIRERCAKIEKSSPRYHEFGNIIFDTHLSTITDGTKTIALSDRQTRILEMLAKKFGDVVAREDILHKIWGNDSYANSLALNVQITYIRRALSIDPSLEITSLKKRGYMLKPQQTNISPSIT